MTMTIDRARETVGRVFFERCFYLFIVILVLVAGAPLVEPTPTSRLMFNAVNLLVVISAVAAVGRTVISFAIVLLIAVPTLVFQWLSFTRGRRDLLVSWWLGALLYAATLTYLLQYVFHRDVMTADKLWGAGAAFLMTGVLWAYLYAIVQHYYPASFAVGGTPADLTMPAFVYFSFTVLTTTGFGDLAPLTRQARSLCVVEQITGALFLAILIARLIGVYPRRESYIDETSRRARRGLASGRAARTAAPREQRRSNGGARNPVFATLADLAFQHRLAMMIPFQETTTAGGLSSRTAPVL
jgi:hypothetical protein